MTRESSSGPDRRWGWHPRGHRAFRPRPPVPLALAPLAQAPSTRPPLAMALALAAVGLAACDLTGSMAISAQGRAQVSVEIGIDRDLIDGTGPTCEQVMTGVLDGLVPVAGAHVTKVEDPSDLRCRLTTTMDLGGTDWDGQSGRPLWSADEQAGVYHLILPLSQGTGSGTITQSQIDNLGITADVTLSVTMPADITQTSEGTVDGPTVTVTGEKALLTDLDVSTGGESRTGRAALVAGIIAGVSVGLGGLALAIRRSRLVSRAVGSLQ